MRLAELPGSLSMEVIRDGEFASLGLLSANDSKLLACLHDPAKAGKWTTNANLTCVLTSADLARSVPDGLGLAIAADPRDVFLEVHRYLGAETTFYGSSFVSEISEDAHIHAGAQIAETNVRITEGCVVESGAVILERVTLDQGAVIRAGAVVGAEGFHPVSHGDGLRNMPHYGSVHVGRRVEIGSNSVICRAVFGNATTLGDECVLGPLVYVAHGATLGQRCRIAASARICGSSIIGNRVTIGPNAVISNLVRVGDGARVSIGSVVVSNVPAGRTVTGNFAVEHGKFLEAWGRLFK